MLVKDNRNAASDLDEYLTVVLCLVAQSCLILCHPMNCSPLRSSVHGDSLGKITGVGWNALLQGIFPTQGSNPGLPDCRWILYCLSHQGSPILCYIPLKSMKKKIGFFVLWPFKKKHPSYSFLKEHGTKNLLFFFHATYTYLLLASDLFCPTIFKKLNLILLLIYLLIFWLSQATCGILVLWPGIKSAVEVCSLNHWTTREVLVLFKNNILFGKFSAHRKVERIA